IRYIFRIMKESKRKMGECVYCGKLRPLTEDHIPPRCLFPKNLRNNLLKIPSCDECHGQNRQVSLDDENFRLMLINRDDVQDSIPIKDIRNSALRSLEKPFKRGFAKSFFSSTKIFDIFSRGGIYLGKGMSYTVDLNRLNRVAERIILGLFYHHKGYRLPDGWKAVAFETTGYRPSSKAKAQSLLDSLNRILANRNIEVIEKDIFSYRFNFADDEPNGSMWLLIFYNRILFIGATLKHSN
ncbi:MAG: HNH endonuclease, partial [Candidatus Aminicenantales bacterium]